MSLWLWQWDSPAIGWDSEFPDAEPRDEIMPVIIHLVSTKSPCLRFFRPRNESQTVLFHFVSNALSGGHILERDGFDSQKISYPLWG